MLTLVNQRCTIRADVDSPDQARIAIGEGAEGIGLYRTEAMLRAPERLQGLRRILVATNQTEREKGVSALLPLHRQDFEQLFRNVSPCPVTIRLLDPPLQELFPTKQQLASELASAQSDEDWEEYVELERVRQHTSLLVHENPCMGNRGCRLCLTDPELLGLQVRAILQAAVEVAREGIVVKPEIMIPLVASAREMRSVVALIRKTAAKVFAQAETKIPYKVGALIELPRAAICAAAIAQHADFISFGTDDLTQMTYGFSREDAQQYMKAYLDHKIYDRDPFLSIDQEGVGRLIESAIAEIRQTNSNILIGICGSHGSDPDSLHYFQSLDVNHISCPPGSIAQAQRLLAEAEASVWPE